jgi:hypothetical protein
LRWVTWTRRSGLGKMHRVQQVRTQSVFTPKLSSLCDNKKVVIMSKMSNN